MQIADFQKVDQSRSAEVSKAFWDFETVVFERELVWHEVTAHVTFSIQVTRVQQIRLTFFPEVSVIFQAVIFQTNIPRISDLTTVVCCVQVEVWLQMEQKGVVQVCRGEVVGKRGKNTKQTCHNCRHFDFYCLQIKSVEQQLEIADGTEEVSAPCRRERYVIVEQSLRMQLGIAPLHELTSVGERKCKHIRISLSRCCACS